MLQIFDDAYKSCQSCIVLDDIERLLGKITAYILLAIILYTITITIEILLTHRKFAKCKYVIPESTSKDNLYPMVK